MLKLYFIIFLFFFHFFLKLLLPTYLEQGHKLSLFFLELYKLIIIFMVLRIYENFLFVFIFP